MTVEIDAMSAASPDMTDAEQSALTDSIRKIGQQVPIIVWRGRVIDGRKRLAACESLSIKPIVTEVPDESDPVTFATALNLLRTHYTPSQRAAFAEKIANATPRDAVMMRKDRTTLNKASYEVTTIREAAGRFGVQQTAVGLARRIRRTAAPEVMQAVECGTLTLHAASAIATKVPHAEQAEVVEKVVAAKAGKRNTPAKIINAAAPGIRRTNRRDVTAVRDRALRTIHACALGLGQFMDYDIAAKSDRKTWGKWISESVNILRTLNRKLGSEHERTA